MVTKFERTIFFFFFLYNIWDIRCFMADGWAQNKQNFQMHAWVNDYKCITTLYFSPEVRYYVNIPMWNIYILAITLDMPHYGNTPIQIYWKFYHQNLKVFRENSDIFHISAQNIDCEYSLEPHRRGGSNEYPQSMFLSRNKKNNV